MSHSFEVDLDITEHGSGYVKLDGREIEVVGFRLEARAGHVPQLTLDLEPFDILLKLAEVDVTLADTTLANTIAVARELTPCPECQQGKHQNCTVEMLVDDTFVGCPCRDEVHQ